MPPIHPSLYQNLLRQGFTKTLANGYAQSVVAATLNTQNRSSFASIHHGYGPAPNRIGIPVGSSSSSLSLPSESRADRQTTTLEACLDALQARQLAGIETEKDKSALNLPKRIEWKPSPSAVLKTDELTVETSEPDAEQADNATQPTSHNVAEDGSWSISNDEQAALAHVDAALTREAELQQQMDEVESRRNSELPGEVSQASERPPTAKALDESPEKVTKPAGDQHCVVSQDSTGEADASVSAMSVSCAEHLSRLANAGRYAAIPPAFEGMLAAGIIPLPAAYNALMQAATHLPTTKDEVLTKALDVYANMLKHRVFPDAETYDILVDLLAARSLKVFREMQQLETKRHRFGGIDEPGTFMLSSHEREHAKLAADDRLDLAVKLFDNSAARDTAKYSARTYQVLIAACAEAGRLVDISRLYEHMELAHVVPAAATFPAIIKAYARSRDLVSAIECYNEYRDLAIAHNEGKGTLLDRADSEVYAAVINSYVISKKFEGALSFYEKIQSQSGAFEDEVQNTLVDHGFIDGFLSVGMFAEAFGWAQSLRASGSSEAMAKVSAAAADNYDSETAIAAFSSIRHGSPEMVVAATALVALFVRLHNLDAASRYWRILTSEAQVTQELIEPTALYGVALVYSGRPAEAVAETTAMFDRIRVSMGKDSSVSQTIDECVAFVDRALALRYPSGKWDDTPPRTPITQQSFPSSSISLTPTVSSFDENFDPYARTTDTKGSSLISDDLEGTNGRNGPRLRDALHRLRQMRRAGRHPRYITYGKLISAASREGKVELCQEIYAMAKADVPLIRHFPAVRYGWTSIFDAMVGAYLTLGKRNLAAKFHQELLDIGASPSANTFGLYITTLKESTKTFDEASEAVKIFHRAKAEGVEPSAFLYNALIGKLGKARRIDDCLFYFNEMRGLGVKPTSVTYGTIVNALCRVSDEAYAEELFEEMESMPNYKARPAPYNSMMQFFLNTKRDRAKVLAFYSRMQQRNIEPTSHTYKLLIDTHATLEPVNMQAAESVLDDMRAARHEPEAVHYAALIHAKGCVLHDMDGARKTFDDVMKNKKVPVSASLFQALFESMVANNKVEDTESLLVEMHRLNVDMTAYIANTLIEGWAGLKKLAKAREIYDAVGCDKREPSTYEAMTRAYLGAEQRDQALLIVADMLERGYPTAVVNKALELLGNDHTVLHADMIRARGCVPNDMNGARGIFDTAMSSLSNCLTEWHTSIQAKLGG